MQLLHQISVKKVTCPPEKVLRVRHELDPLEAGGAESGEQDGDDEEVAGLLANRAAQPVERLLQPVVHEGRPAAPHLVVEACNPHPPPNPSLWNLQLTGHTASHSPRT